MRSVPATELKSKLSAILGDVERGEVIDVTRHGKTIARISPAEESERRKRVLKAIEDMEALRKSRPPTGLTIEDILGMRHEGHRY
jgi:prevent-host-death family protein